MWGKAKSGASFPAHSLLYHMLDVAAVAFTLLSGVLPEAQRTRLLGLFEGSTQDRLRAVVFIAAMHDWGKATPAFQSKVPDLRDALQNRGFSFAESGTLRHGEAGYLLLRDLFRTRDLPSWLDYLRLSTAHHGTIPRRVCLNKAKHRPGERGIGDTWADARQELLADLEKALGPVPNIAALEPSPGDLLVLGGFVSVCDWLGSNTDHFPYTAPDLEPRQYWRKAQAQAQLAVHAAGLRAPSNAKPPHFQTLFPFSPRPLQAVAETLAQETKEPALHIVEAPMGEGKTEAALLLAQGASHHLGADGFYVGMPTKATANQFLWRTRRFLDNTERGAEALVLAHGDASLVDTNFESIHGDDKLIAAEWFQSSKQRLLAPYGVGTIDQALRTVMLVRHHFVGLFGLAGKTVILDEVHAYDDYTGELMEHLVHWLGALGSSVVLLSATLPKSTRERLIRRYLQGRGLPVGSGEPAPSYPRLTTVTSSGVQATSFDAFSEPVSYRVCKRQFESEESEVQFIASELRRHCDNGACVGYIANTVHRAQQVARLLDEVGCRALLIHARLFPEERLRREKAALELVGPDTPQDQQRSPALIVGTQVLEQSLDLDFDVLITDTAPIDLVLQRMGRLHRHTRLRPQNAQSPLLELIVPNSPESTRRICGVYDECVINASLERLDARSSVTLPTDIDALVSEVYDPLDELRGNDAAAVERWGAKLADRQFAHERLIPDANAPEFLEDLEEVQNRYRDPDDPSAGETVRAATRLGESIQVVCLVKRGDEVFLDESSESPFDINAPLRKAEVRSLANRSISVSRPSIRRTLQDDNAENRPTCWKDSALLRHRRLVLFENGEAQVGNETLRLDAHLGLVL